MLTNSWPLLYVCREIWMGDNRWGVMHLRTEMGEWERLCYSYELPWEEDDEGNSKNDFSRIQIGLYPMVVKTHLSSNGSNKGWRLQLERTGHRKYIQVHRASPNLFIQGCILPIHFRAENVRKRPRSRSEYQTKSIEFMRKIKERYDKLKLLQNNIGKKPTIEIAATLPAKYRHTAHRNRIV